MEDGDGDGMVSCQGRRDGGGGSGIVLASRASGCLFGHPNP